jgi:hypothetical protein
VIAVYKFTEIQHLGLPVHVGLTIFYSVQLELGTGKSIEPVPDSV